MQTLIKSSYLKELEKQLEGELYWDEHYKMLYATDGSVYKKRPLGVAYPKNIEDLKKIIAFAEAHQVGIIPRTAGTSLAGQCVGEGLVVDVSKHFTHILSLDLNHKTVTLQPGVIRDDLNRFLAPFGLFFGPNTSTSAYCMIGGMVGNNSSGTTSIRYGVTRDKLVRLETVLSDGSVAVFENLSPERVQQKQQQQNKEGQIYRSLIDLLSPQSTQQEIRQNYPHPSVHRRNTGYALDILLHQHPFSKEGEPLNLAKLLAGSEGTLAFTTSITLQLDPLPPKEQVALAVHFDSIQKAMEAVVPCMEHPLYTCELMDKTILDCTLENPNHRKNRFFIKGDPKAILILELRNNSKTALEKDLKVLENTLKASNLTYAVVPLWGDQITAANDLRNAGLGLLGNLIGDEKAVACIEDTAVPVEQLAKYISEFQRIMKTFGQEVVYYAHAGAGELHLRPILNLKTKQGISDFRDITHAVAQLVKRFGGSLSGEHGDGIVRSEFIPLVLGKKNATLLQKVKEIFDSKYLFNPGKIVAPLAMDKNLRTPLEEKQKHPDTFFDFSHDMGLLRAVEKCNGAGNCRTTSPSGTLCPSYRATKEELHGTRGRANVFREVLSQSSSKNAFDSQSLKKALDLCLSCKACASECPSSVDMATYKAEFNYQYNKIHGSTLRDKLFAHYPLINRYMQIVRVLQNFLLGSKSTSFLIKKGLGVHPKRMIPKLEKSAFSKLKINVIKNSIKDVFLFIDEFSNYAETKLVTQTLTLLHKLGYAVHIQPYTPSGRTYISKGFLKTAKKWATQNVKRYAPLITADSPLLFIEPSALYCFTDEYLKLVAQKEEAKKLANHCLSVESFLAQESKDNRIQTAQFHNETKIVKFHAHCYQKALGNPSDTFAVLNLPKNYTVRLINSGCCGMAGSFGYEAEHYELSMKIGEERLFPAVRKSDTETLIAANGTSCRHQIMEGTQKQAQHPLSILHDALL